MFRRRGPIDVRTLAEEHLDAGRPTGWFEPLYAQAFGDRTAIPWAQDSADPAVLDWLEAPVATPPGDRAVVVGCGLGDDAAALARLGWTVTAFDVSPSAVRWARRRHPKVAVDWQVADVLDLPASLLGRFDLVVEVRTVPSLPGVVRDHAMDAIGRLAAERGLVLVVTLLAMDAEVARRWVGPPWPQAPSELAVYRGSGLTRLALEHAPAGDDGAVTARVTWQRPAGAPATDTPAPGPGLPIV